MVIHNQLKQATEVKQYYLNKPLKHLRNQFLGQVEVNTFTDIVVGLKGAGKSAFIESVCKDLPQHWRLCVIDASLGIENLNDLILNKFELSGDNRFNTEIEKQQYLQNRFYQAIQLGLKIIIIIDSAEELTQKQLKTLLPLAPMIKLVLVSTVKIKKLLLENQDCGLFCRGHFLSLGLFEMEDISKYIKRRLANISYQGRFPFTAEDIEKIFKISKGNPFLIKLLSNQGLKFNNIPLPSSAETRVIYNEIKNKIDLSEYIELDQITKLKEIHDVIREKNTTKKTKNKKQSWRKSIHLALATLFIILIGILFFSEFIPKPQVLTPDNNQSINKALKEKTPEQNQLLTSPSIPVLKSTALLLKKVKPVSNTMDEQSINQGLKEVSLTTPAPIPLHSSVPKLNKMAIIKTPIPTPILKQLQARPTSIPRPQLVSANQTNKLPGQHWITKQPSTSYTIQLMGSTDYKKLLKSIKSYNIKLPRAIIYNNRPNKPTWYSVIAGSFQTKQAARVAIKNLPARLQKNNPWPKTFLSIQMQSIEKQNPKYAPVTKRD